MGLRDLTVLFALALAGCGGERVVERVDASEASRCVAALQRAGVAAEREAVEGGYAVVVPAGSVARAAAVMRAEVLPRAAQPGFDALVGPRGVFETTEAARLRAEQARAGEVAETLSRMTGVLDARVHLALPEPDALRETPARPRASVLLVVRAGGERPDEARVRAVVAGAVQDLATDDVRVAIEVAPVAPPAARPVRVLGVGVQEDSVATARAVFGAPWALLIMATVGVIAWWRRRGASAG
ncbi:MAG: hypothetical protein R3A52_21830 [Polyangiales bacterium]